MTSASIICVRKDVESVLEALSCFGEFHIVSSAGEEKNVAEINQSITKAQDALSDANILTKQLVEEKSSLFAMFKVSVALTSRRHHRQLAVASRFYCPKHHNTQNPN